MHTYGAENVPSPLDSGADAEIERGLAGIPPLGSGSGRARASNARATRARASRSQRPRR